MLKKKGHKTTNTLTSSCILERWFYRRDWPCYQCFPKQNQQQFRRAETLFELKNVHTGENMLVLRLEPHDSAQVQRFHMSGLLSALVFLLLLVKQMHKRTEHVEHASVRREDVCANHWLLLMSDLWSSFRTCSGLCALHACRFSPSISPLLCIPAGEGLLVLTCQRSLYTQPG